MVSTPEAWTKANEIKKPGRRHRCDTGKENAGIPAISLVVLPVNPNRKQPNV